MAKVIYFCAYIILIPVLLACQHNESENYLPPAGGRCHYVKIPGKAVIQEIKSADPTHNNCKNAVEVLFRFVPDDPTAPDRYLHPDWTGPHHFIVGDGKNPPREWVNQIGLHKGVELRAIRNEITRGTCTPVVFRFPEIDMQGYVGACFK